MPSLSTSFCSSNKQPEPDRVHAHDRNYDNQDGFDIVVVNCTADVHIYLKEEQADV